MMTSDHLLAVASSFLALCAIVFAALPLRWHRPESRRLYQRFRWGAPTALGAWFLVAILQRANLLYRELDFQGAWHLLGSDAVVVGCALIGLVVLGQRVLPWVLWSVVGVSTLLCWVHLWHWRFFDDIFSLGALRAVGQARFLGESVADLALRQDFILLLDLLLGLVAAWLIWRGKRRFAGSEDLEDRVEPGTWLTRRGRYAILVLAILASVVLVRLEQPSEQKYFARVNHLEDKGLLALHLGEFTKPIRQAWKRRSGGVDASDVHDWFAETAPQRALGPADSSAPPWNIVLLQVEAFQDFVLDLDVGSPPEPVMPNLRRRLSSGFRFPNTFDQSHLGRTSDAEMLVMASLFPVSSTPASVRFGSNHFASLPGMLGDRGYSSFSAVAFDGAFWNRRTTHPAYGIEQSHFSDAFEKRGQRVGWGLNDREFLLQASSMLHEQPEPFFSFLITLSLHTPYKDFPDELRTLPDLSLKHQLPAFTAEQEALPSWQPSRLQNYLEAMRFFDSAFEEFMGGLEKSGLAQRTVVVLYGDHDAALVRDPQLRRHLEISSNPSRLLAMDRVPMVFWVPGAEGATWGGWVGQDEGFSGLVDVAPTLFGVLGLDATALPWQGRNLRRAAEEPAGASWRGGPVPVGLAGNWISSDLVYISKGPGPYLGRCYRKPSYRKTVRKEPCVEGALAIQRQLNVARDTLEGDLHRRLR